MSTSLRQISSCIAFRICLGSLVLTALIQVASGAISHSVLATSNNESDVKAWAIVLGVGEYEHLDVDTKYADDDARGVSKQLVLLWGSDHVKLAVDSNVVKDGVRDTIYNWLATKEDENDVVLLFLAGHGDCEYIRLHDSLKGFNVNDIHYSEFASWLEILESKNIVIIMDICGSGFFAMKLSGNGRVILTCGTESQKCWQEDTYAHGIFSYYLIEALCDLENVDTNGDHAISAEELFDYVYLGVASEFEAYPPPSLQHPQMIDDHKGDLTLFQIASTETGVSESSLATSWWRDNRRYFWVVIGLVPVLAASAMLAVFFMRRQRNLHK